MILFLSKSVLDGAIREVPWALVALMGFSQAGFLFPSSRPTPRHNRLRRNRPRHRRNLRPSSPGVLTREFQSFHIPPSLRTGRLHSLPERRRWA